jgi:hypothetical protein
VGDNCAVQFSGARHSLLLLLSPSSQTRVAGVERPRLFPIADASEHSKKNNGAPCNRRACKHARSRKLPISDQHVRQRSPILKCHLVLRARPHRNEPFRSPRLQMKVPDRQKEYRHPKRPNQRANQQDCPRDLHFIIKRPSSHHWPNRSSESVARTRFDVGIHLGTRSSRDSWTLCAEVDEPPLNRRPAVLRCKS